MRAAVLAVAGLLLGTAIQGVGGHPAAAAPTAVGGLSGDLIFWTRPFDANAINVGRLDGSNLPTTLNTLGATVNQPFGVAVDAAGGKVYWTNYGSNKISWAWLDGTGAGDLSISGAATVSGPYGLVVDHAANRLYWANSAAGKISWATLDGSSSGDLNTGSANVQGPNFVALDRDTSRVYWANFSGNKISWANLDGSGGGDLSTGATTVGGPTGVVIDTAQRRIYWGDFNTGSIRYAGLGGTGGGTLSTVGVSQSNPVPGAINPASGRLYWANSSSLAYANANGSGGGGSFYPGSGTSGMPVILTRPAAAGAPAVTGGHATGKTLACSAGAWGTDLLGEHLYRAPASFGYSWTRNDKTVNSATSSTYVPHQPGTYRCVVTATNAAGAATQTSTAYQVWTHRPDGLVKAHAAETFLGNDVYNTTGAGQTVLVKARRGNKVVFDVRIENDGSKSDTFKVKGPGNKTGFKVRYLAGLGGKTGITKKVVAGSYTMKLRPGAVRYLRVVVKIKAGARIGKVRAWKVTTWSTADSTADAVKAKVRVIR